MIHVKAKNIDWQKEPGYNRGVLFPYGNEIDSGIQVQLNTFEPGKGASNHKHIKQTEFIYCLEGELRLIFENREIILKPGDLIIIEPGDEHAAENNGNVTVKLLTFKMNGSADDTDWLE